MKSKKAATAFQMILLILAVVVLGVMIWFWLGGAKVGKQIVELAPSDIVFCLTKAVISDVDGDGLEDSCDNCVCSLNMGNCKNYQYDRSNALKPTPIIVKGVSDTNKDQIPDFCQKRSKSGKVTEDWSDSCDREIAKTEDRCVIS